MVTDDADKTEAQLDAQRWLVVGGRRWRRTDPSLADELVAALKSHLGRARNAVKAAKRSDDAEELASARTRVGLAKHGLGERGPTWWDAPEADRRERAIKALAELDRLAELGGSADPIRSSAPTAPPGEGGDRPQTHPGRHRTLEA